MGPRFRKRGNFRLRLERVFDKHAFNGAALSEARKPILNRLKWHNNLNLQWGRAFGSAETRPPLAPCLLLFSLQWGRAFGSAETNRAMTKTRITTSFNGAALSEARKLPNETKTTTYMVAGPSMGPRFRKRGNTASAKQRAIAFLTFNGAALSEARKQMLIPDVLTPIVFLQWGRAFGSAETMVARCGFEFRLDPSMGPRFRKRGNEMEWRLCLKACHPSMGPRFRKRGNWVTQIDQLANHRHLQWGRAFGSAETKSITEAEESAQFPSMGPRFRKRGNHPYYRRSKRLLIAFNGAALSEARKP